MRLSIIGFSALLSVAGAVSLEAQSSGRVQVPASGQGGIGLYSRRPAAPTGPAPTLAVELLIFRVSGWGTEQQHGHHAGSETRRFRGHAAVGGGRGQEPEVEGRSRGELPADRNSARIALSVAHRADARAVLHRL